jgi:hypothetical protein
MLSISLKGEQSALQRDIVLLETHFLLSQLDSELIHHDSNGSALVAGSVVACHLSLLPQKNKLALTRIHQYQNYSEWPFQQVFLTDTFDITKESPFNTFLMVPP